MSTPAADRADAGARAGGPARACAGGIVLLRLTSAAAAFGLQLVLARLMSPADFGALVVVMTWVALAASLGSLSMPFVAMRFIADYVARGALGLARGVWRLSVRWVLAGSAAVAALLLLSAALGVLRLPGVEGGDWLVVGLLALAGPLLALAAGQLQGLQRVITAELLSNLMRTVAVIVGALALLLLAQRPPRLTDMLWIHLAAASLLAVLCWVWGRAARPPGWAGAPLQSESAHWRASAWGFIGVMVVGALSERIDVMVMGLVGAPAEIALYAVATRFSQALAVLLVAVYGGMAPRVAAQLVQIRSGDRQATQADLARFSRVGLVLAAGAALVFASLGPWLLRLFGEAYLDAAPALTLLGAGFVAAALFGPALLVLTLTGRSNLAIAALTAGTLVNALLVALLAPRWGATGAAVGAAVGAALPPLLGWWWLRRTMALDSAAWVRVPAPTA